METALADPPQGSALRPVRGNPGLPFLGYGLAYIRDPLSLWKKRYERYGTVSWFRSLGQRFVMVFGPDACETVLLNKDKAFSNRLGWRFLIGPFFDNGLMLLDFDTHRSHRRLMQQAFSRQRLAGYARRLAPPIVAGVSAWTPAPDFTIYPAIKKLTLDLATDIFMGGIDDADAARMDRVNKAFVDCVQAATAIVRIDVPGGRWHRGIVGRRVLEQFLRDYLPSRRTGGGDDMFSVLATVETESGERFTDDEIIDHMIFLLMAAHDTSTITISTMMQYLGQHPEWQQRCRAESLALGPELPSVDDLGELVSLDLVMKESLRLLAPLPAMARRTVKDTEIDGHFLPKGTYVAATPHFTHHMAEYWPEPEKFDPERFTAERHEDTVHRFAWQPFGGGVHTCIGQFFSAIEIKLVMHHLLHEFEWSVPTDYVAPIDFTSLPFPKDGQPVDLRRR